MKTLITGIAGFAGSHLAEYLLENNFDVYGFYLESHSTNNIEHLKNRLSLTSVDILDAKKVSAEIAKIKPDYIFHLAAFASPGVSFERPKETIENNVFGQLNILEALAKIKSKAKILIVGSAEEYGDIDKKYLPVAEETPFAPVSPYSVSKVTQDMLGFEFFKHENLNIIRVRPFNHIGPRQSDAFVVSAFASQIAKLEKENGGTIKVGNLESSRDFTDVRDMVRAYLLALEKGIPGDVYNIGSEKAIKISDILKMLISQAKVKVEVEIDKSRFRPVDTKIIYCDATKFKKQTGWKTQIPIEKTLSDTIDYERTKLN